jgi:hypothetical protein
LGRLWEETGEESVLNFVLHLMSPFAWTTAGIVLGTVGVLLLFFFGMPFRLSTSGGGDHIITEGTSDPWWVEPTYKFLGGLGVALLVVSGFCQWSAAYLTM